MSALTAASSASTSSEYIEYSAGALQFSAYHFHHNREPFIIMFIKKDEKIYIEMINPHTYRNKYVQEIVMPFELMEKNENLKKYYDMSIMMVNTDKTIYYDKIGIETGQLVSNYDTDSEGEEREEIVLRRWCINSDCVWKNLRVSKRANYNCYYNINPFTYEYNVNTEKQINNFIRNFNAFAKYNNVCSAVKNEIVAKYNNYTKIIENIIEN